MMTSIAAGLGYDEWGNNSDLLTPADKRNLDNGRILRVDGNARCQGCGELYRLHPAVQGALWAVRGCDGLVKL